MSPFFTETRSQRKPKLTTKDTKERSRLRRQGQIDLGGAALVISEVEIRDCIGLSLYIVISCVVLEPGDSDRHSED